MILLIDNYDSFTYNIATILEILGEQVTVYANDQISIADIKNLNPNKIILAPGPGSPDDAGITIEVIKYFKQNIPMLGVCLGHQAIAQAFGGKIIPASTVIHGRAITIRHNQTKLFQQLPTTFKAIRYNSLTVDPTQLPACLEAIAWSTQQNPIEIMAIAHQSYLIYGVQFHPESYGSEFGQQLISNFLNTSYC